MFNPNAPATSETPWLESRPPRFLPLRTNIEVDVVVVGGGITGVTTAWLLRRQGCRVALIERNRIGAGDTGHTTAHLTCVTDERLNQLVKQFGAPAARAVWEAGAAAIDQIESIVRDLDADCSFRRIPGFLHAPVREDSDGDRTATLESLHEDAKLASQFGFDARFIDSVPHFGRPGVRFGNQATFHPGRYITHLVRRLANEGCAIFEDTEFQGVESDPRRVVCDGGHEIRCSFVVICTHNPLSGSLGALRAGLFQTKLSLYTSYVLGAKLPRHTLVDALFWDTSDPYDYVRVEPADNHQLVIFGGADTKTGQQDDVRALADLAQRVRWQFPDALISHRWLGQVIETDDGLPFIGEHAEREFIATGFAGNGVTFGTVAAMMARDAFLGRANPWKDLFRPDRKPFHGGLWRYVTENLDYPRYFVRDRLTSADAGSLSEVGHGEGRIVALESGRCAVYRGEDGRLSVCSAVCTHLGCLVRWNSADHTWDCPCHGSRFDTEGRVLSGPAEQPLERLSAD